MDEFAVYNQLCVLEDIAGQYRDGKALCPAIRENAEMVATRLYRVAVIGEFKRGKSSLINALVGSSVLPTDVIPLTAAITRLVYGTEREIIIHCKDGSSMTKTLSELIDYATKYDEEKAATAATVREIEVRYPSVLCQNHIEIIDTPGLNDNESMSEVTLSVLGEIDAAIVVVSAVQPLSVTEQQLTLDLIRQDGIRHLVFVVTYLDLLMDEEEKDKIVSFIGGRLGKEVLKRAEDAFQDRPDLVEKARRILTSPDIFGVSSHQAMQGFTNDDQALLQESRFPRFKEELLALLTAAQSADIPKRLDQSLSLVEEELPHWLDGELQMAADERRAAARRLNARQSYCDRSKTDLIGWLSDMDAEMARYGMPSASEEKNGELEKLLIKCFTKNLAAVTQQNMTHDAIHGALETGKREATEVIDGMTNAVRDRLDTAMGGVVEKFAAARADAGLEGGTLEAELAAWREGADFPGFVWTADPIPFAADLRGVNVIPTVRDAVRRALVAFGRALGRYVSSWRLVLIRLNNEDVAAGLPEADKARLAELKLRADTVRYNYGQHIQRLAEIKTALQAGKV